MRVKEKLQCRHWELNTRIVMPPMATERSHQGMVTEGLCEFYRQRGENPLVGMIITEHMYVEERGKASPGQMSAGEDDVVEGLKRLTKVVHDVKPGIKVVAQINHAGGRTTPEITGKEKVSASAYEYNGSICRELTVDEIHEIAALFGDAARRVKEGGYDGVEIHSAHGYLLCQFYSPLTNHRQDEYGPQTMENRLRFHKEVLEQVRAAVGDDFPIFVRLGGSDYQEGGSTEEDAVEASKLLETYGADLIDLSGGMCSYRHPHCTEPGYFSEMSSKIKKAVSIPVLLTGGIVSVKQAESLLEKDSADLMGVGRALLNDPDWENPLHTGELYFPGDEEIMKKQTLCLEKLYDFNGCRPLEYEKRMALLKEMFAEIGEDCYIEPPLHSNWGGHHVHFGTGIYANFGLTLVDDTHIYVGDYTMFGPNVVVATAGHPLDPDLRRQGLQYNMPVRIGKNCWIGAGAVIVPGVTIGNHVVIGAGSIVTKDIPDNVLAAGNPCKVIREINDYDKEYYFKDRKIEL